MLVSLRNLLRRTTAQLPDELTRTGADGSFEETGASNRMRFDFTIEEMRKKCPELTEELLAELRNWALERELPVIPDEQLAMFAHSCYFEPEAAKRCMNCYYTMRATVPEFFGNRDPETDSVKQGLDALTFVNMPVPTPEGYRIIFHRLKDTRPSQYFLETGFKLLTMSIEADLYEHGCSPGLVFLFDMQGARLGHLLRISLTSVQKIFEYLQDGLPVRLKAIHVINTVWFIEKILALVRPFLKKELYDMLHFYSGDVSEIYPVIPQKCLPKDFNGELDWIDNMREEHRRRLYELRDYFIEEESLFRKCPVNNEKAHGGQTKDGTKNGQADVNENSV